MRPEKRHTSARGTWTKTGFIPHTRVLLADGTPIDAPVCIHPALRPGELPIAQALGGGRMRYALPGGATLEARTC